MGGEQSLSADVQDEFTMGIQKRGALMRMPWSRKQYIMFWEVMSGKKYYDFLTTNNKPIMVRIYFALTRALKSNGLSSVEVYKAFENGQRMVERALMYNTTVLPYVKEELRTITGYKKRHTWLRYYPEEQQFVISTEWLYKFLYRYAFV